MWKIKTPGIPDELFERDEKVPITKEEVRVIQIAKGRLKPGMIVYDIGCGSGDLLEYIRINNLCKEVKGIEISEEYIDIIKERLEV